MLGSTHVEAVRALRNTGNRLKILVCDGYDAEKAGNNQSQSNIIANPSATMDISKELSAESISSIDREQSPDVSCRLDLFFVLFTYESIPSVTIPPATPGIIFKTCQMSDPWTSLGPLF